MVMNLRLAIATAVQLAPGGCTAIRNKDFTLRALPEVSLGFVIRNSQ